jgi:plasmid stabilization system protein ParE
MVAAFRLTGPAEVELDDILDWSERNFHAIGCRRYAALLVQAMQDIADDPQRYGVDWVQTGGRRVGAFITRGTAGRTLPIRRSGCRLRGI